MFIAVDALSYNWKEIFQINTIGLPCKQDNLVLSNGRSVEGQMLETSAFESLYGSQFTLPTQLIKPGYLE